MGYHGIAYFFGGMFFVNGIPHFVSGVCGRKFPSPFASPPGKGQSSALVNVLWGALNLGIGYFLVWRVGTFELRSTRDVVIAGLGGLLMGVMLANTFSKNV
ncbi:MAG: hypothetical protein WBF06_05380 [Candidatus Acidiferrales bacterium]